MKILLGLIFFSFCSWAKLPNQIKVCDDGDEFPPYSYYQIKNKIKSNNVIGFSVDYLNEILKSKNIVAKYSLIPWPRCLEAVKKGEYDLALNATKNPEREREFLMTDSFFSVRTALISRADAQLKVDNLSDLKKYKICAQTGYNYSYLGIEDKDIEFKSNTFDSAIKMVKGKRCDFISVDYEVLLGYKLVGIGNYVDDRELNVTVLKFVPTTEYFMLLSKAKDYAAELKELIDTKNRELIQKKIDQKLMKKFSK